jgi:aminoglycoside phosphotransferase (APT) family kinase protein
VPASLAIATLGQVRAPGRLLAFGRDADIFEYGPGLVLRRCRQGRSMLDEARTMEYARAHGYPVPAVESISDDGTDLVMERVDGPSMLAALGSSPWTVRHQGRVLARLHHRLHEIEAPGFLPPAPVGAGERLVHLDLHPMNVILGARGPVVIDWANAAGGDPAVDVALAWILLAAGEVPGGPLTRLLVRFGRVQLVRSFLSQVDLAAATAPLRAVVAWKVADRNLSPLERQRMWRVAGGTGAGP